MNAESVVDSVVPRLPALCLKRGVVATSVGTILWFGTPLVPASEVPGFCSLEHVFLVLPLIAMPLAIVLLSRLLAPGSASPILVAAQRVQPLTAALLTLSFLVPKGILAGALALGWVIACVLVAAGSLASVVRSVDLRGRPNIMAACIFLPIGTVWLMLSRLGMGPSHFAPSTVLLAAVHFHFSGFALQILIAATGRRLGPSHAGLRLMHNLLSFVAIVGIPLIAAGNLASVPSLKLLGVSAMVASTLSLGIVTGGVGLREIGAVRGLLLLSSASLVFAMLSAGVYGVAELAGRHVFNLQQMTRLHGALNAFGFTLCGVVGHLRWVTESTTALQEEGREES